MVTFVTSNEEKIGIARQFLEPLGIDFETTELDLVEIQSDIT